MSVANKSAVSALENVESWIRRPGHLLKWGREFLSEKNTIFVHDLYTILACLWYDSSHHPELLNQRWVMSLMTEPVDKVVSFFKDLDYELCSESLTSMSTFNQWRKTHYPTFGHIIAPLADNISDFFNQSEGLGSIRTCLRFITRANFPEPLGLEEEAFEEWKATCLMEPTEGDLTEEARLCRTIFPRGQAWYRCEDFRPKFGPGASYDTRAKSIELKYQLFTTDSLLDYTAAKMLFPTTDLPRLSRGAIRTHRVHFVPKQLDKLRVVSMEPHSLMFYQLGGFDFMNRQMRTSRWRKHIDLEHAELNRDLAWEGSLTGEFATIDLSSASDTVRLWMVKSLFHDTNLRELLIGTRSTKAEYKGELFSPSYFAPMGSGLCFPVECAVFASIVENVMNQNRDRRAWRVYGDDIILPSERSEQLIDRLTKLGFKVNRDKSFYKPCSGFRESCGGDYFRGEDVRPVYVSRFWTGLTASNRHPSTIEGLVDLANRLTYYPLARQRVIKSLLRVKPGVIFDDSGEVGIFSKSPTNFHLKHRYNDKVFCHEYRCGKLITKQSKGRLENEDIRLFEYLRSHATMSSVDDLGATRIGRVSQPYWRATWRSPSPGWDEG